MFWLPSNYQQMQGNATVATSKHLVNYFEKQLIRRGLEGSPLCCLASIQCILYMCWVQSVLVCKCNVLKDSSYNYI